MDDDAQAFQMMAGVEVVLAIPQCIRETAHRKAATFSVIGDVLAIVIHNK